MPNSPWELEPPDTLFAASTGATWCVIGRRRCLLDVQTLGALPVSAREVVAAVVKRMEPGDDGAWTTSWLPSEPPTRLCIGVLPERASRHDAPARPDRLTAMLRAFGDDPPVERRVLVACAEAQERLAYAAAVTRALPTYSQRSLRTSADSVRVAFSGPEPSRGDARALPILRDAIARAMHWQDTPAAELDTDAFVELAREQAAAVGASVRVVRDAELTELGLAGIAAVGRAATRPPALVVLTHEPPEPSDLGRSLAWVGKGVVFDSGGLGLKRPREMLGMKTDMSGAASVLAAFRAAVELGVEDRLQAVLCLAENAVGPDALHPGDILRMHSGKTVEVVDTDCEGRLLLADGVSFAAKTSSPDVIVDVATLTDAAPIATGRLHAALVCNDEALERATIEAGRAVGELVHPLPHLPELCRGLLACEVADLRNAAHAPHLGVSTPAQFIAEHLGEFSGAWLHLDIEGVATTETGRGTGFGVGLLLRTFGYG